MFVQNKFGAHLDGFVSGMLFSKAPRLFRPISGMIKNTVSCEQRGFYA